MAFYQRRGELPGQKHTAYYREGSNRLLREELVSTRGFSGIYSTKYHLYEPCRVVGVEELVALSDPTWEEAPLLYYHLETDRQERKGDFLSARCRLLHNQSLSIATARVTENRNIFFKNAFAHEMVYIHEGQGIFRSEYGTLGLQEGDYLMIPKGTIYQMEFIVSEPVKLLVVESVVPFEIPQHYRNEYGQLLEHAPYSERDFICPSLVAPEEGGEEHQITVKAGDRWFKYGVDHHPFDVVGWDGFLYPYTFNIKNFLPIVGKVHQPPPVHLVFSTREFVVCNFTPRLYDFHPRAIPAPYFHSNVDSDEVIYYVSGDFMSRKGVSRGSITLHPLGLPHGPHPGRIEASVGQKETKEYAVMVDAFAPLKLTTAARDIRVENYFQSWLPS